MSIVMFGIAHGTVSSLIYCQFYEKVKCVGKLIKNNILFKWIRQVGYSYRSEILNPKPSIVVLNAQDLLWSIVLSRRIHLAMGFWDYPLNIYCPSLASDLKMTLIKHRQGPYNHLLLNSLTFYTLASRFKRILVLSLVCFGI